MDQNNPYEGAKIVNIRRGRGDRKHFIYASIVDKEGGLLVSATLEYCVKALEERLPWTT